MKNILLLSFILLYYIGFSQSSPLPSGSFSQSSDIYDWTITPSNVSRSWFLNGCYAMFVDNLPNNAQATIESPLFNVAVSGDYRLVVEYGVVYSGTLPVFELIDASNTVISTSSFSTISGSCSSWPNSKKSTAIFNNLNSGNYKLKITIPQSQFFLSNTILEVYNPMTISGSVNGSGCSNNNMINGFPIKITNLSDNSNVTALTNNGNYAFVLNNVTGNFLIEPILTNATSSPNSINLNVTSSSNLYTNNDFCLTSTINGVDVQAELIPITLARPGFVSQYKLRFLNNGNIVQGSGTITLNFDNTKLNYQNSSETPTNITSNSITWQYTNLTSLEIRNITVSFNAFATPTVNSGDVLHFSGNISPISDFNSSNNTINLNQIVVNGYDPNDIICLEGTSILLSEINNDLTYRIRFQNTGTASAINIIVKTTLDTDIDLTTFTPISASHNFEALLNGNDVSFRFDNINLPDSTSDETNSHGYIIFKVKPKNTAIVGDVFSMVANIYFDYNLPIITNTATTQIYSSAATDDFLQKKALVFPNPFKDKIVIKISTNSSYQIHTMEGVLVRKGEILRGYNTIDTSNSNLIKGVYIITIYAKESKLTKVKLIKI